MGNPNPFYRFKQAWNAGFYPDNQIVSDLLNEIRGNLASNLPSLVTIGTTTVSQVKQLVKNIVNPYNSYPYYGNFEVTLDFNPEPPLFYYEIIIKDNSLYQIDSSQFIFVFGLYNTSTNVINTLVVDSFTPGAYSGSFAEPLINEEIRVSEALEVVNINGSAIFPITYSFDPISNVATSGLARGDNWFIDGNGNPDRQPVPNLPYENRRIFELPQLTGGDTFIISVMERIIQASLNDSDYTTSILAEYNKYTMPEGWTRTIARPVFTTYDRVQATFTDSNHRRFTLVGRLDGQWLWQRFVSDDTTSSAYNFLSVYPENVALPFEPNQAGRWLYNDNTYDFEFVEFISGCYVSPEFYAMPAKPGDQLQFSIVDGNFTGIDSAKLGLFSQDGEFIQQIGEASRNCCMSIVLPYISVAVSEPGFEDWESFVDIQLTSDLQFFFSNAEQNYTGINAANDITSQLGTSIALLPAGTVNTYDKQDFIDAVSALDWPAGLEVNGELVIIDNQERVQLNFCNYQNADYPTIQARTIVDEATYYSAYIQKLCCFPTQMQANVTIPAVQTGCYRMGLYNSGSTGNTTTCELTFTWLLDGGVNAYFDSISENYSLEYFTLALFDGVNYSQIHQIQIPSIVPPSAGLSPTDAETFSNTIPGMNCVYDPDADTMTWTWTVTVDCGINYNFRNVVMDVDGNVLDGLFSTESQSCVCEPTEENAYALYSLSNIIRIDASDCFSTILEFWSDNNSISQGIEYQDNWKQKVRIGLNGGGEKPVIEESLYRQSNGVHRRPQNKQDLSLDLHTDFLDLDTQLALVDATRHPYLIWEGKSIFVTGDIEVATTQDFTTQSSFETLSQVKFQALIQGFQPKNSTCLNC